MTQIYALSEAEPLFDQGYSAPNWYRTTVDPAEFRPLMQKSDRIATRDVLIWLGLLVTFAALSILSWLTWWAVPFLIAYGVLYGSASDARWHECGHNTAFATHWKNRIVYHLASFMLLRNPYVWKASHVRHHTDTIVVGRDPEIQAMRPPDLLRILLNLVGLPDGWAMLKRMVLHIRGELHPDEYTYVREADHAKVFVAARIAFLIHLCTVLAAVWTGSILPILLLGGASFYGAWQRVMTGTLQHLGLAENVSDFRLNTRTVLMDPINRFLYLNMNYHVEHHMFTMVPYYHLPALHNMIRHDLPAPEKSIFAAYRRLLPVLWRQLQQKDAVIIPDLPDSATPYGQDLSKLRPHAV